MYRFNREDLYGKKIGVLMGGLSSEREVSLKTGKAVLAALVALGYDAAPIDVNHDLANQLKNAHADIAFIALHGRFGEDGRVQGLLEMLQIPYTGSGVMTSSIAIDKVMTKQVLLYHGVPTPEFDFMSNDDSILPMIERCRKLPVVVKPSREGSTIGITIARTRKDLSEGIELAAKLGGTVLVENFIEGQELTVSVLDGVALPIIQIVPKGGFYDYRAKYV